MTIVGPARASDHTARSGVVRRSWAAPLWGHVAVLALILAVAFPLMSPRSSFTSDEGAYALQVAALADGSWSYDYRALPFDPTGAAFPLEHTQRNETEFFPYVQHPAYPELVRASVAVLGRTVGLHLWSLVGVLLTAVAAWLLAAEIDPRLRAWSFWLAAAGPVLANGFLLWAHPLSAGVAGLTLVGALRLVRLGASPRRSAAVAAGLAVGVLLRSEGLLFAAAVALAVALLPGPAFAGGLRSWRGRLTTFALVAGPAFVAVLVERAWVRSIAGDAYENLQTRAAPGSYLGDRVQGAFHDLMGAPPLAVVALAVLLGIGVFALRRGDAPSPGMLAVAAAGAGAVTILQVAHQPSEPMSGLFAACPVLLLGVLLVRWRTEGAAVRLLGVAGLAFGVAVVATEYAIGGGLEWGGRFFSPLLAPLAVLAVVGLDRAIGTDHGRVPAVAALTGLVAVGGVAGMLVVGDVRDTHAELTAAVLRHRATITVTTEAILPRVAWPADGGTTWMVAGTDQGLTLPALLARLRASGVADVDVLTAPSAPATAFAAYPWVQEVPDPALRYVGLTRYQLRALGAHTRR